MPRRRLRYMLPTMRMKPYVLIGAGLTWVLIVFWLVARNVILRETVLGPVAQVIDNSRHRSPRSHSYYSGVRSCSAGASPSFSGSAFCVANQTNHHWCFSAPC